MARDIGTQLRSLIAKQSDILERLQDIQQLDADNRAPECMQSSWQLRHHFLTIADSQWEEITDLLNKQVIPLIADVQAGFRR